MPGGTQNVTHQPAHGEACDGQGDSRTRLTGRNGRKMKAKFNSRAAAYAAGVAGLLEVVPCLTILLDRLVRDDAGGGGPIPPEFRTVIYVSFGAYALLALTSLAFIAGIKADEKLLFLPWMAVIIALIVFEAVAIMIHKRQKTEVHVPLQNWELMFVISYVIRLIVNVLGLITAMYHYKELSDGRGTSRYVARRRIATRISLRRSLRRLPTVTDGRIADQPQGFTLKPPPYLEQPPAYSIAMPPPPTYISSPNDPPTQNQSSDSPPPSYSSRPDVNLYFNTLDDNLHDLQQNGGQQQQDGGEAQPSAPPLFLPCVHAFTLD